MRTACAITLETTAWFTIGCKHCDATNASTLLGRDLAAICWQLCNLLLQEPQRFLYWSSRTFVFRQHQNRHLVSSERSKIITNSLFLATRGRKNRHKSYSLRLATTSFAVTLWLGQFGRSGCIVGLATNCEPGLISPWWVRHGDTFVLPSYDQGGPAGVC